MFIEIADDIVDTALGLNGQSRHNRDLCIEFLHKVAIGAKSGKHFYSIPCLKQLRYNALMEEHFASMARVLMQLGSSDHQSLKNQIGICLIISLAPVNPSVPFAILISLDDYKNLEIHEETHLLSENLTDCEFYAILAKLYRKTNRCFNRCEITLSHCHGGGGTTSDVFKMEAELQQHLCLAIADSDKKYANCPAIGSTASKLLEVKGNSTYKLCDVYVMNKVREIENLIPISVLTDSSIKNPDDRTKGFITKENVDFFDIKEGLQLSHLYDDAVYSHWLEKVAGKGIDISQRETLKAQTNSRKEYREACQGINPILPGWGSAIMTTVLSDKNLMQIIYGGSRRCNLSSGQAEEWNRIGDLVFKWGVSRKISI